MAKASRMLESCLDEDLDSLDKDSFLQNSKNKRRMTKESKGPVIKIHIEEPVILNFSEKKVMGWRDFKIKWANQELSLKKNKKTSKERVEIFLKKIGKDALNAYNKFDWEHPEDKFKMTKVIHKFDEYCVATAENGNGNALKLSELDLSATTKEQGDGDHGPPPSLLQKKDSEQEIDEDEHKKAAAIIMIDEDEDEIHNEEPSLSRLVIEGLIEFDYLKKQLEFIGVSVNTKEELQKVVDTEPIPIRIPKYEPKVIPKSLTLMSWNIDGLSVAGLGQRQQASIELIGSLAHDIILLQEVNRPTFDYIGSKLKDKYVIVRQENNKFYFTATLLKMETVKYESHKIILFRNSNQGRSILLTKVYVGSAKLNIMNIHLDSTSNKESRAFRLAQLQKCISIASSTPSDINVIIGGDMNIRDWEYNKLMGLSVSRKIQDVWVDLGSNPATEFTWDTRVNKNTKLGHTLDHRPKLRFDRILLRPSSPETIKFVFFDLTGKDKIKGLNLFPSDHWAIVTRFELLPKAQRLLPTGETGDVAKARTSSKSYDEEDEEEEKVVKVEEFVKDNWDDED